MINKTYNFKDIAGKIDSPITIFGPFEGGEPCTVDFAYFDKEGVCWRVIAHGYRKQTGEKRDATVLRT